MRKTLGRLAIGLALVILTASPALAATQTKTVTFGRTTITCVVTFTDSNGNNQLDTFAELRSVSDIACTVTRT